MNYFITLLKSKISGCSVTSLNLRYEGSISIDATIAKSAELRPGELVHVLNLSNGTRIETYVIYAPENSGIIELNGPAARIALIGDELIILAYALVPISEKGVIVTPVVKVDKNTNKIIEVRREVFHFP